MTKQEKKERRKVRHQLQHAIYKHGLSRDFKAVATGRQMRTAALHIADMLLSGQNPAIVVPLEVE